MINKCYIAVRTYNQCKTIVPEIKFPLNKYNHCGIDNLNCQSGVL